MARCDAFALVALLATACGTSSPESTPRGGDSGRCATCHLPEYAAVSHPPHPGVRPTTCGTCHTETAWHPDRLTHSWPLEGAHAKADCFGCHTGSPPTFEGTSKECVSCHRNDDQRANAAVAKHAQFPSTCATCHDTNAWKPTLPHAETSLVPTAPPATTALSSRPAAATPTTAQPHAATEPRAKPGRTSGAGKRPDSVSGASPAWHR